MKTLTRVALAALVTVLVAGCGGGSDLKAKATLSGDWPTVSVSPTPIPVSPQRAVLAVRKPITVYLRPSGPVKLQLPPATSLGSPRSFFILAVQDGWVRVELPVRPNGSTGWVKASDVKLQPVTDSIRVVLATRTIYVTRAGHQVISGPVAVGSTRNPTPKGSFYVTDLVKPKDPGGAYGEFALGLSAFSSTLTEFAGGPGQVGIHGTNVPGSIGKPVSHGCIRVPDQVDRALRDLKLGTPVVIQ